MRSPILLVLANLMLACGSDELASTDPCPIGTRDCPCTEGGACDPGLVCSAGVCDSESSEPPADAGAAVYFDERDYGDWPDCHARCGNPHDLAPFEVELTGAEGETGFSVNGVRYSVLRGQIDAADHQPGYGYDIDLVRVRAPARRLLEMTVRPAADSEIDPYISTFDPELEQYSPLFGWMTQNDSAGEASWARTVLASPYGEAYPWFVAIDDARNVADQAPSAGGPGFEYELRFRSLGAIDFTELELDGAGSAALGGREIATSGDIHYYRFVDPEHRSYVVTFERENPAFCGHLWQIDLVEGAAWLPNGATDDVLEDGCAGTLSFQTFPAFYQEGTDAYVFAVTDFAGRGSDSGLDSFEYSIRVDVAQE